MYGKNTALIITGPSLIQSNVRFYLNSQKKFTFIIKMIIINEFDNLILTKISTMLPLQIKLYFQYLCQVKKYNMHWTPALVNAVFPIFSLWNQTHNTIFLFTFPFHNRARKLTLTPSVENNITEELK